MGVILSTMYRRRQTVVGSKSTYASAQQATINTGHFSCNRMTKRQENPIAT